MALAEIRFFGNSIGCSTTMNVILPDGGKGPFPVFYLLGGLSDDHSKWARFTSIERYVTGLPLIVIMPNGGRGWYTNSHAVPQQAYEDHLIKDVVGYVDQIFPTIAGRKGRAIGGLSMGGYGAVKLAMKYPTMFCSATSHSGAVLTPMHKPESRPKEFSPVLEECKAIFGPKFRGGPNDLHALARKCVRSRQRPALLLDCCTGDFLLEQNRAFTAFLKSIRYTHDYAEFPGAHEWSYWDTQVQEALAFHRKYLEIAVYQ